MPLPYRMLVLGLTVLCTESAAAQDRSPRSSAELVEELQSVEIQRMPIGVTRAGTPIEAIVHRDDVDLAKRNTRVLLVAATRSDAENVHAMLRWFYRQDAMADVRRRFTVSAVPCLFPDADASAAAVFPPPGSAYGAERRPEAIYLWRWIGMQAPDVVVEVGTARKRRWCVPVSDNFDLTKLQRALRADAKCEPHGLAAALVSQAPCETGVIPAIGVSTPADDSAAALEELLQSLTATEWINPSPARRALQRRLDRQPLEVAAQLSRHYGKELKQVAYIPAVALIGRLILGDLTNDRSHADDVAQIVAPYVDGKKPTSPNNGSALSGHLIFTELASRAEGDSRDRYVELARSAADLAFDASGQLRPSMPFHSEMSDALFMGGPILAHVGRLTGDDRYFDACLTHLRFMRKLVLRPDGLYRHSPLDETAWGRGNGFPALGLALCLTHWPEQRNDRDELLGMFRAHMTSLIRQQDASGCWHQVVDRHESYRELSGTCMITFALVRGVRNGWLDRDTFMPPIRRAWPAILLRVPENGRLVDVCTGTGKQPSLRHYYDRPAILGPDARGGAMALLVATEMAMLK